MDKVKLILVGVITILIVIVISSVQIQPTIGGYTTTTTVTQTTTVSVEKTVNSTVNSGDYEVYFSPGGKAASHIIYWLDRSNSSVCGMIYSFTRDDISAALIRAFTRGVDVKLSMDDQEINVQGGEYQTLMNASVPIRIDRRSGLLHDKVLIMDNEIVITGSYNCSAAAEDTNRENLIIIKNTMLAAQYTSNCVSIWNASKN